MRPIKLIIKGDFWDSQLYRGRLYLWDVENMVHVIDWDSFIHDLAKSSGNHFLIWAFARGNELYQEFLAGPLFKDEDVRKLVRSKLDQAAHVDLHFSLQDIRKYLLGSQISPFKYLYDDLVIFRNKAYALTEEGFFAASVHKPRQRKHKVDRKAKKLWDGRGVNISASRRGLAIAAASDGLFQYASWENQEPEQVAPKHASFSNWLFASIYASSSISQSYLAAYKWTKESPQPDEKAKWKRELAGIINEKEIFANPNAQTNNHQLTWGSQEKIYKAYSDKIMAIRFVQKNIENVGNQEEEPPFEQIGEIPLSKRFAKGELGDPFSAGVSFFGSVVEYPDSVILIESDFRMLRIRGAMTRWRVFPRSTWYPNHLHLVLHDRVEILSINSDIFLDQREKISGIQFRQEMLGEV